MMDGRTPTPNGRDATAAPAALGADDPFGIGKPIARILPDFRLVSKLGEGGMGVVYRAHQIGLDQDVALKILPPQLAENREFVQRFYREARMSVKLKHENIVHGIAVGFSCASCGYNGPPEMHPPHATGLGQERGLHYFAMEFVEGESLDHSLERIGHLCVGDAVRIAIDVAEALDYAHSRTPPVFHRDVKPANIIITPAGEVKLADLGLAKAAEDDAGLTQLGEMAGTVGYMPPEQARNAAMVDGRSDVYALGTTLYVLLTGKKPFTGKTSLEVVEAKERGTFEPARTANQDVPEALDRIIARMLAPAVNKRYRTAGEIAAALRATGLASNHLSFLLEGDATLTDHVRELPPTNRPRRWVTPLLASAVTVVLIAGSSILWTVSRGGSTLPKGTPGVEDKRDAPQPIPPDSVDSVLARAISDITSDRITDARTTLEAGLEAHPQSEPLARALHELEAGALLLFQFQTPGKTSAVEPLWAVGRVTLTSKDNYRFGVASSRNCYVYAYQRDTRSTVTQLFPNAQYSLDRNPLSAGRLTWLPNYPTKSGTSWLHLDSSVGEESVYFIAVTAPLRDPDGFGNKLKYNPDIATSALNLDLGTFLQDVGAPGKTCFAEDDHAAQVFRFEHS